MTGSVPAQKSAIVAMAVETRPVPAAAKTKA
jgi:hypothetical protein